ncbi:MAG: nucleotidyl transferase AbiEii/AbiGii toxin family protein [Paludibacteraceae bacterium]|nr:nucleotidyl transferase AbiEii/AbiGii toxin family protein [Paludibacteraceae bacterium]
MPKILFYNTISPLLLATLKKLMQAEELKSFRLVGGTSLSLQLGHRESVDIDLFTDAAYNSVDFKAIDLFLRNNYTYVDTSNTAIIGMGKSYYVGESANECIKLDLYYTDTYIRPAIEKEGLRLASIEEIIAMKIEVVSRGGRKKDFWDIHELLEKFTLDKMLQLHEERYPYNHNRQEILTQFIKFEDADTDFDPICLKHKYWEIIKLDLVEIIAPLLLS